MMNIKIGDNYMDQLEQDNHDNLTNEDKNFFFFFPQSQITYLYNLVVLFCYEKESWEKKKDYSSVKPHNVLTKTTPWIRELK